MFWRIQWLFACSLVLVILLAWILSVAYGSLAPATVLDTSVLLDAARRFVAPEPAERFVFLLLLLIVPALLVSLVGAGAFRTLERRGTTPRWVDRLMAVSLAGLMYLPFYLAPFSRVLMGWVGLDKQAADRFMLVALLFGLILVRQDLRRPRIRALVRSQQRVLCRRIALVVAAACLLPLLSYRLIGFSRLTASAVWSDHLDAVTYPLSQVAVGRTLLVDLPSQYGLFSEVLALPYRLLPSSLLSLSCVFGVLQLISMAAIFSVVWRYVSRPWLAGITSLALVMITYGASSASGFRFGEADPYFQYWPVRFLWPALSVAVFSWVLRQRSWSSVFTLACISGMAMIWNVDSGIAILFAACMSMVCYAAVIWRNPQASRLGQGPRMPSCWWWLISAAALPVISAAMLAIVLLLLALKGNSLIQLQWFGAYQSTFYGLGFFMIPMPLPFDAWMGILGVYVLAALVALTAISAGKGGSWAGIILYLSLLGAGLFLYYQGRSHYFNLVAVGWPAILISAILTDRQLRALNAGLAPSESSWMPAVAAALLMIPALGYLIGLPEQWKLAFSPPRPEALAENRLLRSELALIRKRCPNDQPCLILAKRQAIYSLEAKVRSPWRGPGPSELLLEKDRERLINDLLSGRYAHVFLGVGPSSVLDSLDLPVERILRRYEKVDTNQDKTILYLRPLPSKQASTIPAAGELISPG